MPEVFQYLTTLTECPCKKTVKPDDNGLCPPCSPRNVLDSMQEIVVEKEKEDTKSIEEKKISNDTILNKMARLTDCDSERCVLESNLVLRYVTPIQVKEGLKTLKPTGPRNTREWLSNFNIDASLEDLVEEYPEFYYFPSTMSDFKDHGDDIGCPKLVIDILVDKQKEVIGCVVNTDKYSSCTGNYACGKHWCALFIDTRKPADTAFTVEFFDPTGDPPKKAIMEWQEEMKDALERYRESKGQTGGVQIVVSTTAHQQENNECGIYSLYFIRARVEGVGFSRFNANKISDEAMINFRRYLFS